MKAQVSLLALSLALGIAAAQTTPANPQAQNPQSQQSQGSQSTATQSNAGSTTSTDTKASGSSSATSNPAPAEMKTSSFKGVLVDLSCAGGTSSPSASASETTAGSTGAAVDNASQNKSANRSTGDSSSGSPSANSTQLGMKLDDGRTVRFDLVGNQRAQDALKNDKRCSKDLAAGKPIHAKVSGALSGDKLIVSSIN